MLVGDRTDVGLRPSLVVVDALFPGDVVGAHPHLSARVGGRATREVGRFEHHHADAVPSDSQAPWRARTAQLRRR